MILKSAFTIFLILFAFVGYADAQAPEDAYKNENLDAQFELKKELANLYMKIQLQFFRIKNSIEVPEDSLLFNALLRQDAIGKRIKIVPFTKLVKVPIAPGMETNAFWTIGFIQKNNTYLKYETLVGKGNLLDFNFLDMIEKPNMKSLQIINEGFSNSMKTEKDE